MAVEGYWFEGRHFLMARMLRLRLLRSGDWGEDGYSCEVWSLSRASIILLCIFMDQSAIVMLRRVYVQKSGGFIGFCALSLDDQPQPSRVDSSHMLDLLRALRGPAIGRMMLSIGRMVGDRTKSDLAEADILRFTWMIPNQRGESLLLS